MAPGQEERRKKHGGEKKQKQSEHYIAEENEKEAIHTTTHTIDEGEGGAALSFSSVWLTLGLITPEMQSTPEANIHFSSLDDEI